MKVKDEFGQLIDLVNEFRKAQRQRTPLRRAATMCVVTDIPVVCSQICCA